MYIQFEEVKRNEYSATVMEDCIHADLGISYDFQDKLAENIIRANWDTLVRIMDSVDGHQIREINAFEMDDPEYCIAYGSWVAKEVYSKLGVVKVTTRQEYWDAINKALINHFFKN